MILKDRILIALNVFFKIDSDNRKISILSNLYKDEKKRGLDLTNLFGKLENPYSSEKDIRLTLDKVIYPIKTQQLKGEVITPKQEDFLLIIEERIYMENNMDQASASQSLTVRL